MAAHAYIERGGSVHGINGYGLHYTDHPLARSEKFYEKLLHLHESVLAGSHPRLNSLNISPGDTGGAKRILSDRDADPDHLVLGDAHRNAEASFQLSSATNDFATSRSFVNPARPAIHPSTLSNPTPQHRQHARAPLATKINPLLLEKSPQLIEAERKLALQREKKYAASQHQTNIAIQRRNLEKGLKQQLDLREGELYTPHDIAGALIKAQDLVAPTSGFQSPPHPSPSTASFDENSYYSSKANTWSTEHTGPHCDQADPDVMNVSDDEDEDLYEPPPQVNAVSGPSPGNVYAHSSMPIPGLYDQSSQQDWEPQWDEEEDDGEDYEPPAPHIFDDQLPNDSLIPPPQSVLSAHNSLNHHIPPAAEQVMHRRQRRHGGPTIIENRIRSPVAIGVNQIQSPAAPQPSRISPLALVNMEPSRPPQFNGQRHLLSGPVSQQGGRREDHNTFSGKERANGSDVKRTSPTGTRRSARAKRNQDRAAADAGKKRKRLSSSGGDKRKTKKGKGRALSPVQRSPEPYIKPEPVSPQPELAYADYAPSRRPSRILREAPDDVDIPSPRSTRPRSTYYGEHEHSPRGYRYAEQEDRAPVPQGAAYRRVERDTQNLRRVASLHYARRPLSPVRDYIGYAQADTQTFEPDPYTVAERPLLGGSAYPEAAPALRSDGSRYIRHAHTPSPPLHGADPYIRVHSPALMPPPPPRQIVVDQYGNRYFAEPIEPIDYRRSVVPPPRRPEEEPYLERAVTVMRESAPRPIRVADGYEDVHYQAMPPPPRSRAYTQLPEDINDPRSHRERAFSVRPQETVLRDAPQRSYSQHEGTINRRPPPPRFDEAPPSSDFVPRAYSVRPEPPRRELVPEYGARPGSVQPGGGYGRRDMPPPPMAAGFADDSYRYPPSRAPVPQRRGGYVDERARGEAGDDLGRSPYGQGRRIINYGQ